LTHKIFTLATPGAYMADNSVNIGINVSDNGSTAKVTKNVEILRDLLVNTAAIAAKINVGGNSMPFGMGGSAGIARTPRAAVAGGTTAIAPQGGTASSRALGEQAQYGALRGTAGLTGSAASNFAEQSQGLGGLVRLYATFAANIYAATAAFTALSKAGDLSNLTKGLDQLGASSGKNLSDLAKRLVDITEGSLSASDAMKSVASASSAGLSTKNIEDLATVAKKASQALGLDLSTAFDRLSRGVTKLEPELLDELGIFTKIGPATEEYARKMGKSVTSLTDFEKRQAFANAVLKEGIDKFGEINLIANPYAKLAASLANLTQSGLELVNKVLGPLVGFLSQSPTALLGIIGLIGATFIKSTIPIIGKFRSTMDQLQAESMVKMNTAAAAQLAAGAKNDDRLTLQAQKYYETSRAVTEKGEKVIADAKAKFGSGSYLGSKGGPDIGALLKKAPQALTDAEMSALAAQRDKLSSSLSSTQRKDAAAYAAHYDQIIAMRKDFNQGMLNAGAEAGKAAMLSDNNRFSNYQRLVRESDKATAEFSKNSIIAMQGQTAAIKGPIAAFAELRQNVRDAQAGVLQVKTMQGVVDKTGKPVFDASGAQKMEQVITNVTQKMGTLDAATTLTKGGFSLLVGGISNAISALGTAGQVLGIVVGSFELLDHWLSAANKDIGLFDSSIAAAKENIAFLPKTLDALTKQDTSKWMSAESLTARANAMKGITDSVDASVKKFKEIELVSNAWDNLLDSFAGVFGKSRLDTLSKTLNASILANIEAMPTGNLKEAYIEKVKELTGVKEVTKEALSNLKTYSVETITALNAAEKSSSLKLSNLASDAGASKAALEALAKTGQELSTSLIPGDPITKYGLALIAVGEGLDRTFKNASTAFAELVRIASNPDAAKAFGSQGAELVKNSKIFKDLQIQYNENDKALIALTSNQKKFVEIQKQASGPGTGSLGEGTGRVVGAQGARQADLSSESLSKLSEAKQKQVQDNKAAVDNEILRRKGAAISLLALQAEQVEKYNNLGFNAFKNGLELIGKGFELKTAEAALKLRGAVANALTNIQGIQLKGEVAVKEIDLRIASNNIMLQLIRSQEEVTLMGKLQAAATAENTNVQQIQLTEMRLREARLGKSPAAVKTLELELQRLNEEKPNLTRATSATRGALDLTVAGKVDMAQYKKLQLSKDQEDRDKAALIRTQAISGEALKTANTQEAYNKKVVILNTALEEIKQKYTNINDLINYSITFNEHNLKVLQQLSSASDSMFFQRLANAAAEQIEGEKSLQLDNERAQLAEKFTRLRKDATQDQTKVAENQALENELLDRKVKLQELSNVAAKLGRNIADITKQADIETKAATVLKNLADQRLQLEIARIDANQSELDTRKNILAISNEEYAVASGRNQLAKLERNYAKETSDIASAAAAASRAALAEKQRAEAAAAAIVAKPGQATFGDFGFTAAGTIGPAELAEAEKLRSDARIQAEKDYQKALRETSDTASAAAAIAKTNFEANMVAAQASIDVSKQVGAFDDLIKKIDSLGVSLSGAFGDFGTKLGAGLKAGVTAVEDARKQQLGLDTKYAKDKAAVEEEISFMSSFGDESDQKKSNDKKLAMDKKYASDSAKTELEKNTKIVGSAKSLFAEKTFAYKALAAVEKAMHMFKIGMDLAEMVSDTTKTGVSVANSATRTSANIGEAIIAGGKAVITAITGPFPMNLVAGAATAAVIGGLLSALGAGGTAAVSTAGKTSEDRQSLGAGQAYVNGVKTDTGGGVLGDSSAKSESIKNSIELLNATQVEGLSYDNKMVTLLTSIDQNIGKAAIGIYGTVGLTKGSALGTQEGTSGFNILGGLFGSSTTTQILDSGIKFTGTFKEIMENFKGAIQGFETVKTTSKDSFLFFSSTSASVTDQAVVLEDSLTKSISEVFQNAGKLFIESGAKLGQTAVEVIEKLGTVNIDKFASLRGLKGADLEKEFNSIVSGILDETTRGLFANLTKFQKFGEGMLQTVTRVIDTNEKINLSLNSIGLAGLNASGVLTESSIAITQAMADAAGGLDKFLEHVKFFADNFLTEAERLAPITAKVTASMTDITRIAKEQGFIAKDAEGIVDTKTEFKSLYLTLSQNTTPAAIELRHQLDLVSESFIKVTAEYEDLIKQVSDANTESATKFMSESEKLIFTRNKERDAIAETNKPLFDLITTLKLASLDLDKATQALLDGFKNVTTAADTAKAALLSAAKSGLATLETEAKATKAALATLVTEGLKALENQLNTLKAEAAKTAADGFRLLETEAINAKTAIAVLATEGLRAFETAVNDAKNALASAVTEGLRAFEAKVIELKDSLASLATEGLRLLETELANTKASIAALATDGLRAFEAAANDAKASIAELATKGLGAFEAVLEDTKNKLKDTIFNGFDLLTTKLTGLQSDLESLGTDGFNKLKGGVDNVKNSIKESYKAAVETQKNASKAFIDSLKTVGTGIKDFLKTVAGGDLGIADQATKYKALRTEFDKTLKLAKAGDEIALGKLPQLSQDLLTAAKEQSSTKLEYARTFADVTSQLGDISAVLDTKIQTAEKDAADGVAALETSSLSTADALKLANDELAKWTDAIEKSGVAVEIKAEADAKLQLSTASGALTALDTARTSLNTWLDLIGSDAAAVLTKTDPATLTELKATFATLRTNIADVNTTINTYIKDNNEILKTAGYTGTDLLKNLPVTLTVANTKTQIAATVKLLKDADDAVVGYIAGTKTFLASKEGGGFTAEEIDRILKRTDSPLTTANTNDKLNALKKILKDADDAIIGYIAKTATFLASKEGGGFTAEEIDKILKRTDSPLTKENTQDKLDAAVKSLKDADYALIKYISGTTEFLNNNGFSAAEIDKILKRTDSPLTKENTKDKLVEAAGKLTAAENAVTSYINGSTEFLKTHGFSQEEIDKILKRTDSPFTIENTGNKINAAVKALKDSEDALTKYIGGTVEFLTTHGFSQEEIDKILKRTESPLTKENTQDKLNAAVLVLNAAETAITKYITDITTFLRNNGFSQEEIDKILKRTDSPLTIANTKDKLATAVGVLKDADNAIIAYIAGMKTFLADKANGGFSPEEIDKILKRTDSPLTIENTKDKFDAAVKAIKDAETAIVTYIASTNTILTTAGFSADELLKRTNILTLDATVTDAKKKYDDAVIEVGKWADKLKELGVSFTPYGSPADVGLTALAGKFTTAQTAFNTANTAITDWVGRMTSLVNSISLPGVPVIPPVAVPVVTTPGTGTVTSPVTKTHERPPAPGSNYTWNQTGPNADDGYWSYYQMEIGGPFALGGAFDYGNMMKFAAGDSFSNSIVDKPTKFRMGLMGEAGPEAIMPLTRGPDGSLGVTAQMPDFGNSNEANMVLVNEIKELRNEVAKLRVIASQNEYNTRKTKETLQLVTVGGEYMQTKSVT